jgi:uncharacterized membrane protein
MTETKTRTVVRAISYRITAWLFTIFWTWLFTDDLLKSAGFASALHVLLTIDYYFHERLWLRIRWGLR